MYLSRLILNPRHHRARRDFLDCDSLHQTVMSGLPRAPKEGSRDVRAKCGVLHRLERDPRSGQVVVYVQSGVEPDWSQLYEDGYLLVEADIKTLALSPQTFPEGSSFVFRLRANPTKRLSSGAGSKPGPRRRLGTDEDRLVWLRRKAAASGFELAPTRTAPDVPDVLIQEEDNQRSFAPHRTGKKLAFGSILFQGRLIVRDPERFAATVSQGIGSGKAFGFGMLSLAKGA